MVLGPVADWHSQWPAFIRKISHVSRKQSPHGFGCSKKCRFNSYFITPGCPEGLKAVNPKMKIIVVVRDPFSRLVSDFYHEKRMRKNTNLVDFKETVLKPNGEVQNRLINTSIEPKMSSNIALGESRKRSRPAKSLRKSHWRLDINVWQRQCPHPWRRQLFQVSLGRDEKGSEVPRIGHWSVETVLLEK